MPQKLVRPDDDGGDGGELELDLNLGCRLKPSESTFEHFLQAPLTRQRTAASDEAKAVLGVELN